MKEYANWTAELGDPTWFLHDRLGLFIHFGLYSMAARHEWLMTTEQIHPDDYERYFKYFNPELMDMKALAKKAKAAGMKYAVLTTKHHEGFALWDTQQSSYKITNTPFKRDLVKEYVEAFRAEGIKIGSYHSQIDWHHPDFTLDGLHPLREDTEARGASDQRNMAHYIDYLKAQVTELLTEYGEIDYIWFDFSYGHRDWGWSKGKGRMDWQAEEILKLVMKLQFYLSWFIYSLHNLHKGEGLVGTTPEMDLQISPHTLELKDDQLHLSLSIRYSIDFKEEQILRLLQDNLPTMETTLEVTRSFVLIAFDRSHPMLNTMRHSYESVTGLDRSPIITTGANYARFMPNIIAFGPSFQDK